jgi:anti-anti-sigma factor
MDLLRVENSVRPDAVVVVTAIGEVDFSTTELLADRAREAHRLVAMPRAVVIDLTGVRFLSAAGVGVLVAAHRRCALRGVPLLVVAPDRRVRRTLEACDVLHLLHVVAESPAGSATTRAEVPEDRVAVGLSGGRALRS